MQGQRGTVGSLPETLNFDHGSTSSNAAIDQQICWNNLRNPGENRIPDYLLQQSDMMNIAYVSREQQSLDRWNLGEPSSSVAPSGVIVNHGERKAELGWSSVVSPCPRLEDQRYEPTNSFSLNNVNINPLFVQNANSDAAPQNLNLNASFVSQEGDNIQHPVAFRSSGSGNGIISSTSGSDPFLLPSGSGGFVMEGNDGRPGSSLDGRRASCKRKALEGNVAQSSLSGSSAGPAVTAWSNAGSNLSLVPPEQVNPRLGLGSREASSNSHLDSSAVESTHRNFRIRISSSNQQSSSQNLASSGNIVMHSGVSSSQVPPRLLPVDHPLDLRSAPATDNTATQSQPFLIRVPALPRSAQSFRWHGGSTSRAGSSSSSVGDGLAVQRGDMSSRSMERTILDHPMFVSTTERRNLVRNSTNRRLAGGNTSIPRNVASASRTSSTSGVHPPSGPWDPHENPPLQYPRRLTESIRRQLLSSTNMESLGQPNNHVPLHSGPATSQDMLLPSGTANQGSYPLHLRSPSWTERHGDGGLGLPYSLRNLAVAGDGSGNNRLVSEIRNVLGLMRRGESIRLEDVMILDQSVFWGVADIHDRHRDMRLDVDNMSYEELLALEERIGSVSTGLAEEAILTRLKQWKYSNVTGSQLEAEPCCICQEEYNDGEDLGSLDCGHDFHTNCIKQWLMHKNLCPICKTTAMPT